VQARGSRDFEPLGRAHEQLAGASLPRSRSKRQFGRAARLRHFALPTLIERTRIGGREAGTPPMRKGRPLGSLVRRWALVNWPRSNGARWKRSTACCRKRGGGADAHRPCARPADRIQLHGHLSSGADQAGNCARLHRLDDREFRLGIVRRRGAFVEPPRRSVKLACGDDTRD